jgi:5-formaminoimidazole-4-carboxamide-1-beta-D-ribofuranosyl 5'-monophosphate synthetase
MPLYRENSLEYLFDVSIKVLRVNSRQGNSLIGGFCLAGVVRGRVELGRHEGCANTFGHSAIVLDISFGRLTT